MKLPGFGRRRLRFLVSCCNIDGALFAVEWDGSKERIRQLGDQPSTGLTRHPDGSRLYVAHPDSIEVLTPSFKRLDAERYELPGADTHDLRHTGSAIVVVETSLNRVVEYAAPSRENWAWHASPGEGDRSHINSLYFTGTSWWASMFTAEGLGEPWRERTNGVVMEIPADRSRIGGRIIHEGIQQPHSMVGAEGALWICESRLKRVLRYPLHEDSAPAIAAELPAYARGLAVTPDWIAVGQSRSDAHFVRGLVEAAEPARESAMCGVWFIHRASGERTFVALPALEVYDILHLPA